MSVSGPDLGRLTDPARRGFAQALREIRGYLGAARAVELYGASGSLGAALAANLVDDRVDGAGLAQRSPSRRAREPFEGSRTNVLLYVVPDEETAEARAHDLGFFLPAPPASDDPLAPPTVLELPAPDSSPYAEMQPDRRTMLRRMAALFRLSHGFAPRVLVASAASLFRRVVPRAPFDALCQVITAKTTLDRELTIAALVRAGFSRAPVVEDAGTFAVRGAVIDLFPPVYRHPVRIELFGDEIESIRLYDAATQRTLRPLDAVHLHPVRETIQTAGADPRSKILAAADAAVYPSSKTRRLLEQVDEGELFFGIEALAPAFHAQMVPLFDYLPADALCVIEDPEAVVEEARRQESRLREMAAARHVEHRLALPAHEFVLGEEEAACRAGGAPSAGDSAGGDRALRRGPGRSATCADRVVAAHLAARRAARGARARHRATKTRSTSASRCAIACAAGSIEELAFASSRRAGCTPTGWPRCCGPSAWRPPCSRTARRAICSRRRRAVRWRCWWGRCGVGSRCRPIG